MCLTYSTSIKELPIDERPREKLVQHGVDVLSNSELLAILLRSGTKEMSAIEVSSKLLSLDSEGICYLADSTIEELSQVRGIGVAKACQILAAIELGKRIATKPKQRKINVSSPREVAYLFIEKMRYFKKEFFKVLLLNTKNEIIMIDEVSVGNLNSAIVHPREVFTNAVRKSASSVILVHNHPSGNPNPSSEDVETTKRLVEAGRILGIEVLDHLIIGDGEYFSLRESSMI
ncbi:MAG: DNA repair protein RadC [Clostridia bacterium]|nr:DNA repair protein RadC [Clostridia bacterium]